MSGALLNATEAKMRLTELIGEELAGQLAKPEWKVRVLTHLCSGYVDTGLE